jgi:hypothetical protein
VKRGIEGPAGLDRYDIGVLLGGSLYLLLTLFTPGGTPYLLGGDELGFWMNAQRLLHGEFIYQDFFEFTPPGTDLIYLAAFKLLGSQVWVTNVVILLLGTALGWSCFRLSRLIMPPPPAALAAAAFLIFDFGKWLDGTHHWFSMLAVMAALAVLLQSTTSARLLICGALLGVASFFTQTRGVTAAMGVAAYLVWQRFQVRQSWSDCLKRQSLLVVSFLVAWAVLSGYFIVKVGIWRLWYFQVTFVREYMRNQWNGLPPDSVLTWPLRYSLVYGAMPVICALALAKLLRKQADLSPLRSSRIALLAFVSAALFLEVSLSPNPLRVYCVAIPSIVLAMWLMFDLAAEYRPYVASLLCAGLLIVAAYQTWSRHRQHSVTLDLPGGRMAATALSAEKLSWIANHTQPGEYFFQSRLPAVYLPLALRIPTFTFLFHETRPEFLDLSMRQLEQKQVRYILWSPGLETPPNLFATFHQFLLERYHKVWTFSDQEAIWELNAVPGR